MKPKSNRGFNLVVKRSFDGKIGVCEAGGTKSFYFASDKSAEQIAKEILEEVKNDNSKKKK